MCYRHPAGRTIFQETPNQEPRTRSVESARIEALGVRWPAFMARCFLYGSAGRMPAARWARAHKATTASAWSRKSCCRASCRQNHFLKHRTANVEDVPARAPSTFGVRWSALMARCFLYGSAGKMLAARWGTGVSPVSLRRRAGGHSAARNAVGVTEPKLHFTRHSGFGRDARNDRLEAGSTHQTG